MSARARAFQLACRSRSELPRHNNSVKRAYATQSSLGSSTSTKTVSRRAVTVTSDDGRYDWNELSRGEKAARTTQQTFNTLLVAAGLGGTACIPLREWVDANVVSASSPTSSTKNSSLQTARLYSSTTPSTESKLLQSAGSYWGRRTRSSLTASLHRTNGPGLAHLRIRWRLTRLEPYTSACTSMWRVRMAQGW